MDDMGRFLAQQNLERYRKLLETATDDAQRCLILRLLAEEEQKMSEQQRSNPQ